MARLSNPSRRIASSSGGTNKFKSFFKGLATKAKNVVSKVKNAWGNLSPEDKRLIVHNASTALELAGKKFFKEDITNADKQRLKSTTANTLGDLFLNKHGANLQASQKNALKGQLHNVADALHHLGSKGPISREEVQRLKHSSVNNFIDAILPQEASNPARPYSATDDDYFNGNRANVTPHVPDLFGGKQLGQSIGSTVGKVLSRQRPSTGELNNIVNRGKHLVDKIGRVNRTGKFDADDYASIRDTGRNVMSSLLDRVPALKSPVPTGGIGSAGTVHA